MKTSNIILTLYIAILSCVFTSTTKADITDDFSLPFVISDPVFAPEPYPVLSPLADGPIRILYIGNSQSVAQVCGAVAARLDSEYACVLTRSRSEFGLPDDADDALWLNPEPLRISSVFFRLDRELEKDWDVIWLDFDIENIPGGLGDVILDMVDHGTGLILSGPDDRARRLSTGRGSDDYLAGVIGYSTIDDFEVRKRGDGTIVNLPGLPQANEDLARGDYFNAAAQSMLFASGRALPMVVRGIQLNSKPVEHESIRIMKYRVSIYNTEEADSVTVTVRYRSEKGRISESYTGTFLIAEKNNILSIPYPHVKVGVYSLDITGETGRGIVFSAGGSFSVDSVDRIDNVNLWYPYAPRDDFILGTVTITNPFKRGMYVTVDIRDADAYLLDTKTLNIVPGRKSVDFIMSIREYYPRAVEVAATFFKNNIPVETVVRPFFISDDPEDRLYFGAFNTSGIPLGSDVYRTLTGEGFDLYAASVSTSIRPEDMYEEFSLAGSAGLHVIPDISLFTDAQDRSVSAVLDTLAALDPSAIMVGSDAQAHQVRNLMPELPLAYMPFDANDYTGNDSDSLYSITFSVFQIPTDLTADTQNSIKKNSGIMRALLIPDSWKSVTDRRLLAAIPWWALFQGYRQLWWGETVGDVGSALSPWGSIAPLCEVVAEEVRNGTNGIDMLLSGVSLPTDVVKSPSVLITSASGDSVPTEALLTRIWHDDEVTYITISLTPGFDNEPLPDSFNIQIDQNENPAYVYDVVERQYLGVIDEYETKLEHGACLIALMPHRIRAVTVTPEQLSVVPDALVDFSVRIETAANELPGRHILKVELVETEHPDRVVSETVVTAENGVCHGSLYIPEGINGQAILRVYDITSSRSGEHLIIIRNQNM